MKLLYALLALFGTFSTATQLQCPAVSNGCVSFTVGSGTGCAWMCNYCQQSLGTTNYYFPDGVCSYQSGGCQGSPQAGKTYQCCTV